MGRSKALAILAFAVFVAAFFLGPAARQSLFAWATPVAALVSAAFAFKAYQRLGNNALGTSWVFLALGFFLWFAALASWAVDSTVFVRILPFPSFAELAFLFAYVPAVAGALYSVEGKKLERLSGYAMLLLVGGGSAVLVTTWFFVFYPLIFGSAGFFEKALGMLYSAADYSLLFLAAFVFFKTGSAPDQDGARSAWRLMLFGMGAFSAAGLLLAYDKFFGQPGVVGQALFFLGHAASAIGAHSVCCGESAQAPPAQLRAPAKPAKAAKGKRR